MVSTASTNLAATIAPELKESIEKQQAEDNSRRDCEARGGKWNSELQQCIFTPEETKEETVEKPEKPSLETFTDVTTGEPSGITLPSGRTLLGLNRSEVEQIATAQQQRTAPILGAPPVGTAAQQARLTQEGQQLAGQVGQFQQQGVSPTGLDFQEAATQGLVGAIPRALSLAATGAGVGLIGGTAAGPIGVGAGAAIGAVGGFVSGIASSMISNFKSQRSDTTTAQQRVLDEGKQTLKDWATLAANDPTNRAKYLAEYNKVAAQIDQAYRQMLLDTSRDVAKFETALPNLAEFEAFYAVGGERDTLDAEMQQALLAPVSQEYAMAELAQRRRRK